VRCTLYVSAADAKATHKATLVPWSDMDHTPPIVPPISRKTLHHGAKFDYEEATWTAPDGRTIVRQFVRHIGSVVILPILEQPGRPASIVLIRNRRWSIPADLWELPAGTRERDEDPRACAARELEEETGFAAATLEPLARFHTSPGMTNELMHAFVAKGLQQVGQRLEADEGITVHATPIPEVLAMIDRGDIMDAKTLAAVCLAMRIGLV
jgi:ADP-ribose pyrophosphatase